MTPFLSQDMSGKHVVAGLFCVFVVYSVFSRFFRQVSPPLPPGPRALPLIGNLLDLPGSSTSPAPYWAKHYDLYGMPSQYLSTPVSSTRRSRSYQLRYSIWNNFDPGKRQKGCLRAPWQSFRDTLESNGNDFCRRNVSSNAVWKVLLTNDLLLGLDSAGGSRRSFLIMIPSSSIDVWSMAILEHEL